MQIPSWLDTQKFIKLETRPSNRIVYIWYTVPSDKEDTNVQRPGKALKRPPVVQILQKKKKNFLLLILGSEAFGKHAGSRRLP